MALGDYCSFPWPLAYDMSQGSMPFIVYMKRLSKVIGRLGLRCHQYSEITHLCLELPSDLKVAGTALNQCLGEGVG